MSPHDGETRPISEASDIVLYGFPSRPTAPRGESLQGRGLRRCAQSSQWGRHIQPCEPPHPSCRKTIVHRRISALLGDNFCSISDTLSEVVLHRNRAIEQPRLTPEPLSTIVAT